jgi:hypothetical protein
MICLYIDVYAHTHTHTFNDALKYFNEMIFLYILCYVLNFLSSTGKCRYVGREEGRLRNL